MRGGALQEVLDILDGHGEAGVDDLGGHARRVGSEEHVGQGGQEVSGGKRLGLEDIQGGAGESLLAWKGDVAALLTVLPCLRSASRLRGFAEDGRLDLASSHLSRRSTRLLDSLDPLCPATSGALKTE